MNKIIDIALSYVGYHESPPNSNMTDFGKWFGLNGKPWCGMFVSKVYDQAGHCLGPMDYSRGFAGVPFALNLFTKRGEVIPKEKAQPGDLVIYDWDGNGIPDHVGIFKGWHVPAEMIAFDAVEGNTGVSKSADPKEIARANSDGGEVALRNDRTTVMPKGKVYFIHPHVLDIAGA